MSRNAVFERFAHEYDWMTNASAREPQHDREVAAMIARFHPTRALDAGCGTGLTSVLFARRGIAAVGLDQSKEMVAVARRKYQDAGLPISFRVGSFDKLPALLQGKFDLVVSVANSLSGVESVSGLTHCVKSLHSALMDGGALVVQVLNGAALKVGQGMALKATQNEGVMYLRYLDRSERGLTLEVIRVDGSRQPVTFELFRSTFPAFERSMLVAAFKSAGFGKVQCFANLLFSESLRKSSRDLVVIGIKSAP